eukprot:PLAT5441.1.p1 GENE.PLAT5441.1~~PLAT5441.1.p1  ORF type:complete len:531 (-),score=182.62 PLAT5441.1:273-1865(-)
MGKHQHGKDRMFVTRKEWKEIYGGRRDAARKAYQRLPFTHCALTLTPWETPVALPDGSVFDFVAIVPYVKEHGINPITGEAASLSDIIRLTYHRNAEGEPHCPSKFRPFNEHSHIVAIKPSGNVFLWESVKRLNIDSGDMHDLVSGQPFTVDDVLHLQDPRAPERKELSRFFHLRKKGAAGVPHTPKQAIKTSAAADRVMEELKKRKEAMAAAKRKKRAAEGKSEEEPPSKILKSRFSTGRVSSSFTSTAVDIRTSDARGAAGAEEVKRRRWDRVQMMKRKGYVRLKTNMGNLNIEVFAHLVPQTAENFLTLCARGYYDGTVFHRLIPGFMVQGGDPTATGKGGKSMWNDRFRDEFHSGAMHRAAGVLSMANSGPDSNGSQFFITFQPTPALDWKHAAFGKLVGGMDVLRAIEAVPTTTGDRPVRDIRIESAFVFRNPFDGLTELLVAEDEAAAAAAAAARPSSGEESKAETKEEEPVGPPPAVLAAARGSGVGKYIRRRKAVAGLPEASDAAASSVKRKPGGFGDFSGW